MKRAEYITGIIATAAVLMYSLSDRWWWEGSFNILLGVVIISAVLGVCFAVAYAEGIKEGKQHESARFEMLRKEAEQNAKFKARQQK